MPSKIKKFPAVKSYLETTGSVYKIFVFGQIYAEFMYDGFNANAEAQSILSLSGQIGSVELYFNSVGGDYFAANALKEAILSLNVPVKSIILGSCLSAATHLAMAASRIEMSKMGEWMIHNAIGGAYGSEEDLRTAADRLANINENQIEAYAKKSKKSKKACMALYEQFLTADQAIEEGFVDALFEPGDLVSATGELNISLIKAVSSSETQKFHNMPIQDYLAKVAVHAKKKAEEVDEADIKAYEASQAGTQQQPPATETGGSEKSKEKTDDPIALIEAEAGEILQNDPALVEDAITAGVAPAQRPQLTAAVLSAITSSLVANRSKSPAARMVAALSAGKIAANSFPKISGSGVKPTGKQEGGTPGTEPKYDRAVALAKGAEKFMDEQMAKGVRTTYAQAVRHVEANPSQYGIR